MRIDEILVETLIGLRVLAMLLFLFENSGAHIDSPQKFCVSCSSVREIDIR